MPAKKPSKPSVRLRATCCIHSPQSAADACVAPRVILGGHAHDEGFDVFHDSGPTWASFAAAVVLLRHELTKPTHQRVWRYNGVELLQGESTNGVGSVGQQASLFVSESNSAVLLQLFFEHAIFCQDGVKSNLCRVVRMWRAAKNSNKIGAP